MILVSVKVTSYYKSGRTTWDEPYILHEKSDICKYDDWHSIMACHLANRKENFPIITWSIES